MTAGQEHKNQEIMRKTKILWTLQSWNPMTGCSKASAGCDNCYAENMARRLRGMGVAKYANGFTPTCHPQCLNEPFTWKEPTLVFVCSMGDLFHPMVEDSFIEKVMETIENTPQHTYQILTKRSSRMAQYFTSHAIPDNAWLGTSVETAAVLHRIETLKTIDTPRRFLSMEPLIGDLGNIEDLLQGIAWVIVGGESGNRAREMKEAWVVDLKNQCDKLGIPFFFKQWGAWKDGKKSSAKANGCLLQGQVVQDFPKGMKP